MSPSVTTRVPIPSGEIFPSARPALGFVLMGASLVFFTANALLIKRLGAIEAVDTWLVSFCRFLVGLALCSALYLRGGHFRPLRLVTRPLLVTRGILGGLGVFLYYVTIPTLGAGRATVINTLYVLFSILLAALLLRERVSLVRLLWGAVACLGVGILSGAFADLQHRPPIVPVLLALLGALVAGGTVVSIRRMARTEHFSTIFAAQCFYGLLIAAGPAIARWQPHPTAVWLLLILSGALAGAGQMTMTRAYRELSVAAGGSMQLLLPVCIMLGGILFFSETYGLPELIGVLLVLAGCRRLARP